MKAFIQRLLIGYITFFLITLLVGCSSDDDKFKKSPSDAIPATFPGHQGIDYGRDSSRNFFFDLNECQNENVSCVDSIETWNMALSNEPETIVLLNGKYDLGYSEIKFSTDIISESIGSVVLFGDTFFQIEASDVKISGFHFTDGGSPSGGRFEIERRGAMWLEGERIEVSDNTFDNIGINSTTSDITGITLHIVNGTSIHIHNNIFKNSKSIAIKTSDSSKKIYVYNNDFLDSINFGGNGEVFHSGDGFSLSQAISPSMDDSYSEFHSNYISNWNLEKELISIKSNYNKVYNNYITDSGEAAIVIRMGNRNSITNNVMINSEIFPVRISGEHNLIENNTFCGSGVAISFHAEMVYDIQLPKLYNSYWAANYNTIKNNSFFGYGQIGIIDEGYAADADTVAALPVGNVVSNNIFVYSSAQDFIASLEGANIYNNFLFSLNVNCRQLNRIFSQ